MRTMVAAGLLGLACLRPAAAQAPVALEGPWAAGLAIGAGQASVASDQRAGEDRNVYLLDFRVSRAFGERLRVGLQLGGWGFEPGNVNDPSEGEAISTLGPYVQVYPSTRQPVFVEAGVGVARYVNNAPDAAGATGSGWSAGVGYTFLLRPPFWATMSVHTSGGQFGDVENLAVTQTGQRYRAFDFRLAGGWRFGRRPE